MKITKDYLLHGCLLSSIAHAIMTNVYPDLSYEQSWSANNYSVVCEDGSRGTITFLDEFCIGAIRNEKSNVFYGAEQILKLFKGFPKEIVEIAQSDTLQFMLDYHEGASVPFVTSVFWCDHNGIHLTEDTITPLTLEFSLFRACVLHESDALNLYKEYYLK